MESRAVSLLTDYGHADEFVGVLHGVLESLVPGVRVIDVCHELPAFDVVAGAMTLARSIQYLPPGAVVAVVDPAVGTARRALGVEVSLGGGGSSVLIGPDNGLLAPAVAVLGGPRRVVSLDNEQFHLRAPGATFAGRDVFAPAAAHVVRGGDLGDLGPQCDPASLLPCLLPVPNQRDDGALDVSVLWVDRFGNAQLNVGPDDLGPGDEALIRTGETVRRVSRVAAFADLSAGRLGLVLDSYGMYALAFDRDSAAGSLGLKAGDRLVLEQV